MILFFLVTETENRATYTFYKIFKYKQEGKFESSVDKMCYDVTHFLIFILLLV